MKAIELEKAYNPKDFEDRIYKEWVDKGCFKPASDEDSPLHKTYLEKKAKNASVAKYTVVIPPPNVTGVLHVGHGLNNVLQDIVVRYHRMKGDDTLWLTGTDHAGIATQNVVERALKKEGLSRNDLGREKFLERTWALKEDHHATIVQQQKKLGNSTDWDRERFTMDEGLSKAVRDVFVTLYERGLIYKGHYLVNWCPRCGTALADDEVDHIDTQGAMYHIYYEYADGSGRIEVATTRPETFFGDTAVAVNPNDERYKALVGKKLKLPITGKEIPDPVIGMSLNERINNLNEMLVAAQDERNNFFNEISNAYPTNLNTRQLVQVMNEFLISAMKVNMRVPEYREGDEASRQKLAQQRKAYLDAEKAAMLLVSSAQKNENNPLPLQKVEKFTALNEKTKILAKKILYSQIDITKISRRAKKITDNCSAMSDTMKRSELKNMLVKKREYLTVPAKNARCDTSLLCQPDSMPLDYAKDYEIFREFTAMDMDMFNVPRVRMYGIPRAIFVPGQGLGTYDWSDNSFLIPAFPIGGNDKSVSYALAAFRWDSDEDRRLKTPYEGIKENKKKSLLAMAASFYKDYSVWLTKEKRGYRLLPGETHKAFVKMFTTKPEE